ncbi:MAG: hypothetical protein Q9223_003980 [Gallowayella weberi]
MFKVFVAAAAFQAVCLPFRLRGAVPQYSGHRPPLHKRLHQVLLSDSIGLPDLDLLTVTATELQELLAERKISTVDLVKRYLAQIENHNHKGAGLNAIISTAPQDNVLQLAQTLDDEWKMDNLRGPMHGIPILVKDVFLTPSLGMETTCGSFALKGQRATRDATAVEQLMNAGFVIIAKASLTVCFSMGGVKYPTPFLSHNTPAGSSSGSAVGVAAGFAPVSIGAETDGSMVQPATRAALYGLKASHGSTALGGVLPGALSFDCLGGFAKTPADLAEESETDRARIKIAHAGAHVVSPVELIQFFDLFKDPTGASSMNDLICYEFRKDIANYLALYPDSPVKTLEDLVKFNEDHAELELPEHQAKQDSFEKMLKLEMTQSQFDSSLEMLRRATRAGIDKALSENSIDVILGPSNAMFASMASAAGYPVASMPLGFADFNGRAFGVQVLAKHGQEDQILRVMSAWEATFPEGRVPPPSLVNWKDEV